MVSIRLMSRSARLGGRSVEATARSRQRIGASLRQHPSRSTACLTTLHGPWQFPAVAVLLRDAREEITAFADFPQAHWRKIWSTNPLERLNKEVKRRTDVVGIFPDDNALLRLASCVLIEAHDEWQVSDRRYLSEASMALLTPPEPTALEPRPTDPNEVIDQHALQTA